MCSAFRSATVARAIAGTEAEAGDCSDNARTRMPAAGSGAAPAAAAFAPPAPALTFTGMGVAGSADAPTTRTLKRSAVQKGQGADRASDCTCRKHSLHTNFRQQVVALMCGG